MTAKRASNRTRRPSASYDPEPATSQPAIAALARRHAEAALAALVEVMADRGATPAARISAASAVLNWGFGKAATGEGEETENGPVELVIRWLTLQDARPPREATQQARASRGSRS
jgi:hypothetical protein